jgi:hypothetical protein
MVHPGHVHWAAFGNDDRAARLGVLGICACIFAGLGLDSKPLAIGLNAGARHHEREVGWAARSRGPSDHAGGHQITSLAVAKGSSTTQNLEPAVPVVFEMIQKT